MYLDRIFSATPETSLIARDSLAQRLWEAVLCESGQGARAAAWPSDPLITQAHWFRSCWESAQMAGLADRSRLLLTSGQTDRLWQQVIEQSDDGLALIASSGVSAWARSARRSLLDAGIQASRQHRHDWQDDAAAFLTWNTEFERRLAANGWVDPESLIGEINNLPATTIGHDLLWLDPAPLSAGITRLNDRWRASGFRIETVEPDGQSATTIALIANDPRDELDLMADWAVRRLETRPEGRLAIVIPDLESRPDEIERAFIERIGHANVVSTTERSIDAIGVFGAALTAIELLSGSSGFGALSRWLRSPFFADDGDTGLRQRAALEIALRRDPRSQQPFVEAWQRQGLRSLVERRLPDTAQRIDTALARLPLRATPTTWTGIWQACLDSLGWQGFEVGIAENLQSAWDNVWAGFSELTPIVGALDPAGALEVFRHCVKQQSIYPPMPLHGIHLLQRISQIGPGFAAAWFAGCSDEAYPEPNSANPLLPWSVQAACGMPGANPDLALAAARAELDRLYRRVPEAVFSCPRRTLDQPLLPSPLVSGWAPASGPRPRFVTAAASRIGARAWQQRIDPAPPLTGDTIPGGTHTLDLQASSPAKAFCVARLRAQPLELPARGIDPRLKGLLIHRALECLLDPDPARAVDPDEANDSETRLELALTAAFRDFIRPGGMVWDAQVHAEKARIRQLLSAFCAYEADRDPFTTIAVERKTDIEFDAHRLRCRIDRIDRLADGGDILIDYKTGRSVGARWFDDRLSECQLPIYAQSVADVAGIATIRLQGSEVEYRGAGRSSLSLPGRVQSFDEPEWNAQLARWRDQLKALLDEFSAGDVRVRSDAGQHVDSHAMEHAGGAFAPLTRVGDGE